MSKVLLKLKPSSLSNNLAGEAATEELRKTDNFETLRKAYLNLMHQLEMDGVPKEKVSTVGQKIIKEKKIALRKKQGASEEEIKKISTSTWWFIVAKEENYIDPFYSHGDASQLKRENSSITETENENYEYLNLITDTITLLKDVIEPKLKENPFMSLLDNTNNKVSLALHDWRAHLDLAQSYFDHKEKIPVNTQHILFHAIGTYASNNEAGAEYFRLRENAHKVTSKQISKYRSGQIPTKIELFNPQDRITAVNWNFIGEQCKNCNSWRVLKEESAVPDLIKCQDCNNISKKKAVHRCNYCKFPYFEDETKYIKEHNSCPNCKEELPEYLINNIIK